MNIIRTIFLSFPLFCFSTPAMGFLSGSATDRLVNLFFICGTTAAPLVWTYAVPYARTYGNDVLRARGALAFAQDGGKIYSSVSRWIRHAFGFKTPAELQREKNARILAKWPIRKAELRTLRKLNDMLVKHLDNVRAEQNGPQHIFEMGMQTNSVYPRVDDSLNNNFLVLDYKVE